MDSLYLHYFLVKKAIVFTLLFFCEKAMDSLYLNYFLVKNAIVFTLVFLVKKQWTVCI